MNPQKPRKNRLVSLVGTFCLFALVAQLVAISPGRCGNEFANPNGKPKQFKVGNNAMYAIWHDNNGWHVRTTTAMKLRHFKGSVAIGNGVVTKLAGHNLEPIDAWKLSLDKKTIVFDLKTQKGVDGIDFQVSPGTKTISFDLRVDGVIDTEFVWVGHNGQHPQVIPFFLPAFPTTPIP